MHQELEEEQEPWWKGPIKYIIMLFLLLLIIIWPLSYYAAKIDPEPKDIPMVEYVVPADLIFMNSSSLLGDIVKIANPNDQAIKQIADKISAASCDGNKICHAKAIYYFIRDKYSYVADPINSEYIEDPKEFLSVGGGDCESGSIALAVLEEAIGIDSQLVLIKNHAYVRIHLPNALKRYKIGDWVYLDWTCKQCSFGEIPWRNVRENAAYLEVP